MAGTCSGLCQRCHLAMEQEFVQNEGGARAALVEKFGERNHMDPVGIFRTRSSRASFRLRR